LAFAVFFVYLSVKKMHYEPDIKVIGFDADDTLWDNEPHYRALEQIFCELVRPYLPQEEASRALYKTEVGNMPLYGYGAKAYTLSIIETALEVSGHRITASDIRKILDAGKILADSPIRLLDKVEEVLQQLSRNYTLIVATKGDLLDQERKLRKSGLAPFFHHIEIMSDKQTTDYKKLFRHLDISAEHFLMVGNSICSDILPVIELGGYAVHIPYHTTWLHEQVDEQPDLPDDHFMGIPSIALIPEMCPWITIT